MSELEAEVRTPVTIRLSDAEREFIAERAKEWCDGNLSEWVRIAALNYEAELEREAARA